MATTAFPSQCQAERLPRSADLREAFIAASEGLEALAARRASLPRSAGLAALRVLWNAGLVHGWELAAAQAGAARVALADILLAADGGGSHASDEDSRLLLAVDRLCGDGSPEEIRARVDGRLPAPARAAFQAFVGAIAQPRAAVSRAGPAAEGTRWLHSWLLEAAAISTGR